jgi:uncharacterized protein (TIGR03118 family)
MKLKRRELMLSGAALTAGCMGAGLVLVSCKGSNAPASPVPASAAAKNQYHQTNLAANKAEYQARFTEADFVNAWGIAIRPQGAGGHFWVGAGGVSWQYVGDVAASVDMKLQTLFQDGLKKVMIPGADSKTDDASAGKTTGVVFNGADLGGDKFRVTKQTADKPNATQFDGSARFIFVTDSGRVSAWTDRAKDGSIVRVDGPAQEVFDGSGKGSAFFGVAVKTDTWDTLWLADFGAEPQIRTLDKDWKPVPTKGFANPFATGAGGKPKPGDPVPFNIQVLNDGSKDRVLVAYAISQPDPKDPAKFHAAEEDALDAEAEAKSDNKPDKGKLVEFDLSGRLVKIYEDSQRLNAPWGVAIAPPNFGKLSGALLVGNFGGAGRISAFDMASGKYIDELRSEGGKPVAIAGLWGLQFGNGESLGDVDALYFAAGPQDEADGLFGSLRYVP